MPRKAAAKSLAPVRPIEPNIHILRGRKVMLDIDLAVLYGVSTSALNQAVRRNRERFPEDFLFCLTPEETVNLKSQSVISSWGGRRTLPSAFTQEGVAMLSGVLRSARAVQMNILIMRAFVRLRELIANNKDLAARVEKLERGHERAASIIEVLVEDIDRIGDEVKSIKAVPVRKARPIGFRS